MALFSILVDIAAKTASFEEGIKRVESQLAGFQKTIVGAGKSLLELGGITLGIGSMAEFVKGSLEAAAAIETAAQRAGVGVDQLSKLKFAAEQSNVSFEALTIGLKKFQNISSTAASGNQASADALARLNIQADQLRGLKLQDQLGIIADQFKGLTNAEDRTSIATQLFGRSGNELIPLLLKGRDGLKELTDQADRLGITLDERSTKAIDRSGKAIERFWAIIKSGTANRTGTLIADIFGSGDDLLEIENKVVKITALRDALLQSSGSKLSVNTQQIIDGYNNQIASLDAVIEKSKERTQAEQLSASLSEQAEKSLRDSIDATLFSQQRGIDNLIKELDPLQEIIINAQKRDSGPLARYFKEIDEMSETSAEKEAGTWIEREFAAKDALTQGLIDQKEFEKRRNEIIDTSLQEVVITTKHQYAKMSEESQRFGQEARQNFSDFFFDPINVGLRGLAQSFANTIRRMLADAAAAQLFKTLFGNGKLESGNNSGVIGSGVGALFNFFGGGKAGGGPLEQNKWYIAGERGPEPIWGGGSGAMAMGYGGMGGGDINVHNNYTIDARGNTDLAQQLPGILKEHGDKVKADLIVGIRNKKYPI